VEIDSVEVYRKDLHFFKLANLQIIDLPPPGTCTGGQNNIVTITFIILMPM